MTVLLQIAAAASEQPAMIRAAEHLSQELTASAGRTLAFRCVFAPSLAALGPVTEAAIVIASLLPELDVNEPWPEAAQRLRAGFAAAAQAGDRQIFVCTILRHVAPTDPPELANRLRIRIRRLNLLAAELSHEIGLYVIDIDRALADIGARILRTDHRLAGPRAAEATAACIAGTLLAVGLDQHASSDAQEAARAAITAYRPLWHDERAAPHAMIRSDVIAIGTGRRRQRVAAVVDGVQENHAGWLLRSVLTRRISLPDAVGRLRLAISQRGLRACLTLLAAGLVRLGRGALRSAPTQQ